MTLTMINGDVGTAVVERYGRRGGAEIFTRLRCSIGRSRFDVRSDYFKVHGNNALRGLPTTNRCWPYIDPRIRCRTQSVALITTYFFYTGTVNRTGRDITIIICTDLSVAT